VHQDLTLFLKNLQLLKQLRALVLVKLELLVIDLVQEHITPASKFRRLVFYQLLHLIQLVVGLLFHFSQSPLKLSLFFR
jgi:hypothetical protein